MGASRRCSGCGRVSRSTTTTRRADSRTSRGRWTSTGPLYAVDDRGRMHRMSREEFERLLAQLDPGTARMLRGQTHGVQWTTRSSRGPG
jgi:hypothetical protein